MRSPIMEFNYQEIYYQERPKQWKDDRTKAAETADPSVMAWKCVKKEGRGKPRRQRVCRWYTRAVWMLIMAAKSMKKEGRGKSRRQRVSWWYTRVPQDDMVGASTTSSLGDNPAPPSPGYNPAPPSTDYNTAPPSPGYSPVSPSPEYNPIPPSPEYNPVPPSPGYNPIPPSPEYNPVPPSPGYEPVYHDAPNSLEYSSVYAETDFYSE
ncbi:hypothetical protein R1sor_007220 [Riccia sorocarpa]|uniref:Uncharacterized protein n=1 Tax=Riccia sorocarpa TaxID=122646 RepID=A0ABD3HTA0_9MARC